MNNYLPHVIFVAIGIAVGGMLQHYEVASRNTTAYSSTGEVPVTMSNTAVGATAGGIGAWLISMSGLFNRIMAIIGVAKKIKDAVPPGLVEAISKMIKDRKVNLTLLIEQFKQVDTAVIMALVKELVALVNGVLVTKGEPLAEGTLAKSATTSSTRRDEPIMIEIV